MSDQKGKVRLCDLIGAEGLSHRFKNPGWRICGLLNGHSWLGLESTDTVAHALEVEGGVSVTKTIGLSDWGFTSNPTAEEWLAQEDEWIRNYAPHLLHLLDENKAPEPAQLRDKIKLKDLLLLSDCLFSDRLHKPTHVQGYLIRGYKKGVKGWLGDEETPTFIPPPEMTVAEFLERDDIDAALQTCFLWLLQSVDVDGPKLLAISDWPKAEPLWIQEFFPEYLSGKEPDYSHLPVLEPQSESVDEAASEPEIPAPGKPDSEPEVSVLVLDPPPGPYDAIEVFYNGLRYSPVNYRIEEVPASEVPVRISLTEPPSQDSDAHSEVLELLSDLLTGQELASAGLKRRALALYTKLNQE